jgi:hypothetical protein
MMFDLLAVAPFVVLLYENRLHTGKFFLFVAAGVGELFSPLPFGASSLALIAAYMIGDFFLHIFDASSRISMAASFFLALAGHATLFTLAIFVRKGEAGEVVARGILLYTREVFIGTLLLLTCIALEYAIRLFQYALLEEKIR